MSHRAATRVIGGNMAIRYNKQYNKEIARVVKNFNETRNRAIKNNYKNVPPLVKVSDLKARYTTRAELNKELTRLKKFKADELLKTIENRGGAKAVKWEFNYLKGNLKNAEEYYKREYDRAIKRAGKYVGERQYVDNIKAKLDLLQTDIAYMNQSQFKSAMATIREYVAAPSHLKAQYRGFLNEVEWVMQQIGYSKEKRDKIFDKFSTLTPSQFLYAYDNNDMIARIYRLYHKNNDTDPILTDTHENAEELLDNFVEQIDVIVDEAKTNMD